MLLVREKPAVGPKDNRDIFYVMFTVYCTIWCKHDDITAFFRLRVRAKIVWIKNLKALTKKSIMDFIVTL